MVNAPALHNLSGNDKNQRWFMDLEDVPETLLHDMIIELLKLILKRRFYEDGALVASNMACRWDPDDARVGVDPDVILVMPSVPVNRTRGTTNPSSLAQLSCGTRKPEPVERVPLRRVVVAAGRRTHAPGGAAPTATPQNPGRALVADTHDAERSI